MTTKTSLPIFPTGKGHISYSEVMDWHECSFRHKLKHIKKIQLDGGSVHTAFGKAIHTAGEGFLTNRELPPAKEILSEFKNELNELDEPAKVKALEVLPEFIKNLPDMIGQIPEWFNAEFEGWELVAAEKRLYEGIEGIEDIRFKGFLDAVIKIKKQPTKKLLKEYAAKGEVPPDQYQYWILDWKTCSWGWKADMKRSFEKQMQLILYKHFFCKNMGIPLDQVKCGFVLIKRLPKVERSPGDRMELVPVSVGPVAIDKALKVVHNMVNQVRMGFTMKNRRYCRPFCPYMGTTHCP